MDQGKKNKQSTAIKKTKVVHDVEKIKELINKKGRDENKNISPTEVTNTLDYSENSKNALNLILNKNSPSPLGVYELSKLAAFLGKEIRDIVLHDYRDLLPSVSIDSYGSDIEINEAMCELEEQSGGRQPQQQRPRSDMGRSGEPTNANHRGGIE